MRYSNFHFVCPGNLDGEIQIQMPNQKANVVIGPKQKLQLAFDLVFGGPIRALVFNLAIGFGFRHPSRH